jgi:ribosomal protein S18 acetylase RimI-like enzyme
MGHEVIALSPSQIKPAYTVLGRAFYDDPLFRYLIPDDARRARLMPSFHSITIRYAMRYGEVYTTPEIDGVSCWLPPGHTMPTWWGMLHAALHGAPVSFGLSGLRRYLPIGNYTEKVHEQAAPDPHWYLWELGVDPSHQHQGVGGLLMQPILDRAARDHLPCYLETMNAINVPFYEKRGFIVVSNGVVPGCELRVWGMVARPASDR